MRFGKLVSFVILLLVFGACKKAKDDVVATPPPTTPGSPSADDLLKDSVLLLSKDIYLWTTQVPASFDARSYDDPDKLMEGIREYSIEPGFSGPVDRFSFAIKKDEWDSVSAGLGLLQNALTINGDFGMTVFFKAEGDLRVRLVEPNSPAGLAGIHRGWRVTKINGSSNITTANSTFIVDNIYGAAAASVTFQKPDNSVVTIDLAQEHYQTKPLYLDTVYSVNNKKIGYMVFNSFLGKEDELFSGFQRVFNKFTAAGVSDVIMDLRYNGGGYVSVQEKLADYLVNSSADGSIMMKEVYNANNTSNNVTTKFSKEGALNLNRVYFIVGRGTASASELLINNLKPYMDVRLVGGTTYGKPVGFFPIPVGDWYIFPVSFRSFNKNGEGNYFNGISVNSNVADGLDKDWGDLTETSLASAIRNITTGNYRGRAVESYTEPAAVTQGNQILEAPLLKLTIGKRPHF